MSDMQGFEETSRQIDRLRLEIEATESQLNRLKIQLQAAEQEAKASQCLKAIQVREPHSDRSNGNLYTILQANQAKETAGILHGPKGAIGTNGLHPTDSRWPLTAEEYTRYGRQLIMPEIGLNGQLRLKKAKVLIVGVGGLGCPAAAYLAGAGIGNIGLMDGDTVEASNLHRQIAHATARIGLSKVDSAYEYLHALNPLVHYDRHDFDLSPESAMFIFEQYDLILDCTDHPTSRYLISDACVLTGKPLVSASALKTEGQLIVLNNPPRPSGDTTGGPCYRCIFPRPPPAESVLSCGEGGILGPVVGVMGVLQALQAIKLLVAEPAAQSHEAPPRDDNDLERGKVNASMLIFSAYSSPQCRTVRLRSRRDNCAACSTNASISMQALTAGSLDYIAFCGITTPIKVLPPEQRTVAGDYARLPRDESHVLIDVRDKAQYGICALPGSVNVPWTGDAETWLEEAKARGIAVDDARPQYLVCRVGNDSQLAAKAMMDQGGDHSKIKDIKGGLKSWRREVDHEWPDY